MIINAEDLVMGRLASFVAKKALNNEKVIILNAERAIIVGNKNSILKKFKTRIDLKAKGNPRKGPKFPRMPHMILKNAIKGMLPYKKEKGRKALKNVKVFIGVPDEFKKEKVGAVKSARYKGRAAFVYVGDLSRELGAKW